MLSRVSKFNLINIVIDYIPTDILNMLSTDVIESFIEKHVDRVNWYGISRNQNLSEAFIKKYADRVNWTNLWRNTNLLHPDKKLCLKLQLLVVL